MTSAAQHGGWRAGVLYEDLVSEELVLVAGYGGPQIDAYLTGLRDGRPDIEAVVRTEPRTEPPTLRIPADLARVLADALGQHFGGSAPTRTQRADFEHERGRVDRLINAFIDTRSHQGEQP